MQDKSHRKTRLPHPRKTANAKRKQVKFGQHCTS